ncbi:hypothetical protein CTI12_AA267540 [Artemisia annua]|uniref:Uncharacterized protein n=1 Tax=Artemisia annua TaxID=35608 RepID=A0A2U1N2N0_ARTAN|nr:hypothetical protein CTI12_AA267540 [Artemisia annua]
MATVEVESVANTLPENVENTPKVSQEVEPSPPAPEPVVEEPTKEPVVDAPAPVARYVWMLLPQLRRHQPLKSQLTP